MLARLMTVCLLMGLCFEAFADAYQNLYQAAGWVEQRNHFQDALRFAQQRYRNTLPSALYEALVRNSNQRFAAAAMDARAMASLRGSLGNPQPALAFYQSPLGRKIVAAELLASSKEQLSRNAEGVPSVYLTPERRLLIQQLSQALPVRALGAEFSLALAGVAADSLSQMMPGLLSSGQSQGMIEAQRQRFMNQMDVEATLAYLYRELFDSELSQYLLFAQSVSGQSYYQAALQSVRAGLATDGTSSP